MTPQTIDTLRAFLELGWPAIVTVAFYFLAQAYMQDNRAQISRLWERISALESELLALKRSISIDQDKQFPR